MSKRIKTDYPGVFYRNVRRIGAKGTEKVYYVVFKRDGKVHEEKAGRQFVDDITPAKAAGIRAEWLEGKRLLRKEARELEKVRAETEAEKWTIDRLWTEYKSQKEDSKSLSIDEGRYNKFLKDKFGLNEPQDLIQLEIDRIRLKLLKKKSPQTTKHVFALLKRIVYRFLLHSVSIDTIVWEK